MNICRGWCLILYYSTSKVNNRMNSQTLADQETGRICVWRTHLWRRCSLCRRAAIRDDDGGENPRESEAVMARGIPAMGESSNVRGRRRDVEAVACGGTDIGGAAPHAEIWRQRPEQTVNRAWRLSTRRRPGKYVDRISLPLRMDFHTAKQSGP
jgi:hypothetical protein